MSIETVGEKPRAITETHQILVSGLQVNVVRKDIKNLHLGVYPPHGQVRVAVPLVVSDDAVRRAVIGKLGWIKRKQAEFEAQPRQSQREMVSGESHYYLGRRYRVRIVAHQGAAQVSLPSSSIMELRVRPDTNADQREKVLQQWYRRQLKDLVPPLIEKWQARLGVEIAEWGLKRMKTKWGTCNIEARRIWLNTELIKKPLFCIEYVVVHELIHLIERRHNDRFVALLDQHLPRWREQRDLLNALPLAHETW